MIKVKNLKNGKKKVTSSYWDDIKTYRASLADSKKEDFEYWKWRKDKPRDFSQIELATVVECMKTARLGCSELSDYIKNLKDPHLENYKFDWGPMEEYESYDDLCSIRDEINAKSPIERTKDDISELERVEKEIKSIDDFVEKQLESVAEIA